MTREAAQRDGASETARTRRLGAGDGAGEMVQGGRRRGAGDGETAGAGEGKLLTVEPFGGDTLPASSVGTGG